MNILIPDQKIMVALVKFYHAFVAGLHEWALLIVQHKHSHISTMYLFEEKACV